MISKFIEIMTIIGKPENTLLFMLITIFIVLVFFKTRACVLYILILGIANIIFGFNSIIDRMPALSWIRVLVCIYALIGYYHSSKGDK